MGAWGTPSCLLPEHCHPQGNVICFSSKRKKEKKGNVVRFYEEWPMWSAFQALVADGKKKHIALTDGCQQQS
jgi:hypothetical protein